MSDDPRSATRVDGFGYPITIEGQWVAMGFRHSRNYTCITLLQIKLVKICGIKDILEMTATP